MMQVTLKQGVELVCKSLVFGLASSSVLLSLPQQMKSLLPNQNVEWQSWTSWKSLWLVSELVALLEEEDVFEHRWF